MFYLHSWCLWKPDEEDVEFSETWVIGGCQPSCWCWESNPPPLEEQPLLLTFEPSLLHCSVFFFQTFCCLSYLNEYLSWGHFASDNKSIHSSHLKWLLNTDVPVLCKLGSFFSLLKFPTLFKGALLFHVMNTVCFNFISRILRLSI